MMREVPQSTLSYRCPGIADVVANIRKIKTKDIQNVAISVNSSCIISLSLVRGQTDYI